MGKSLKFVENISSLNKLEFEDLTKDLRSPFINYDFLSSLELSECVTPLTGWQPNHLVCSENEKLNGFMPLYLKDNSHGEFVFDHSWSYALNRTGRKYYPKLLSAVPFTPCETKKIIGSKINNLFIKEVVDFMNTKNIETWHVLFPDKSLHGDLKENNFIERNGYKFVWKNKDYDTFEDYLSIFKSRQRKNIRTERRKISELDIDFEIKDAKNLNLDDWDKFYIFYKNTYEQRFQRPYLNKDFFKMIHDARESVQPIIFFAKIKNEKVAGSLCFKGGDTLFGRHWGSLYNIDSLHLSLIHI